MSEKTAIVFAGQGAQHVGMGRDFADAFPAARRAFDEANEVLGMDLASLCFEGPADRLNKTDVSQPAIFTTSVAIWRTVEDQGTAAEFAPAAMGGLSLGEYTALHAAGWIEFADCLRLVAARGRLMQAAAEAHPGGMVSVMNLDEAAVEEVCRQAAEASNSPISPANFNCPGQIVVSGAKSACERVPALVEQSGGRAVPLVVAGAFHSALMADAAAELDGLLKESRFSRGRIPVVSNVSGHYHGGPESIRDSLRDQVIRPVRWQTNVERLIQDGVSRFVEIGPGRVLSGLIRKISRAATTVNVSSADGLQKLSPEARAAGRS